MLVCEVLQKNYFFRTATQHNSTSFHLAWDNYKTTSSPLKLQYRIISTPHGYNTTASSPYHTSAVPHHPFTPSRLQNHIISSIPNGCSTTSSLQALMATVPHNLLHTTHLQYHIILSRPHGYSITSSPLSHTAAIPHHLLYTTRLQCHIISLYTTRLH